MHTRIHICPEDVEMLYLELFHYNEWEEKEERDDQEFLHLEGESWKKMCPHHTNIEEEEGKDGDDDKNDDEKVVGGNVDDDEESVPEADVDGHGPAENSVVDLFVAYSDDVNLEDLKLPGVEKRSKEEEKGGSVQLRRGACMRIVFDLTSICVKYTFVLLL